jgi:hypothetical protein
MEALRPPTLTPASQLAYAATAGLNPTGINPIDRQQNIQQEMAMQQVQLIQRAQEHAQQQMMQKQNAARGVLSDALFGPNATEDPAAREVFARQHAAILGQIAGQPVPQSVIDQWKTGGPNQRSQRRLAEIISAADIATDPDIKAQTTKQAQDYFLQHGGTPEDWPQTQRLMSSPAFLADQKLPSQDSLAKIHAETEAARSKTWFTKNSQFASVKGQEQAPGYAAEFAQNVLHQDPTTLDPSNPDDLKKMQAMLGYVKIQILKQQQSEDQRKQAEKQAESDIQQAREIAVNKAKLDNKNEAPMTLPQKMAFNKDLEKAGSRVMLLQNVDQILQDLPALKAAGLLPTGESVTDTLMPWIARNTSKKNNTLWTNFELNWAPLVIGQIDRNLKDEKGQKSIQAFGSVFKVGANPPPAEALDRYLRFVRNQIIEAGQRDVQNKIQMRYPGEAIDTLKGVYEPFGATGPLSGGNLPPPPPGSRAIP